MKSILASLVIMITLSTTTCQIGNWIYSSQNIYQPGDCIPGSILISQSGNTTIANYTYNQVNPLENCPSNFSLYETANLTNRTNVFSDTIGQKLTYSPTNSYQSLTLTLSNKHVYYYYNPDLSVLFSEALEGLSATWTNPTANASSNATCYVPTSLFTAPGPQFALNGQILLQMYYQSNYVSHYLYPASTSVSVLTWVDNTTNPDPALQISLAWLPNNSPVTLNFTFYYVNNTCDYIYDRSSALFLTGTMQYLLDWQSAGVASSELTLLPQVTDNINYLQSRTYNTSFGSFTQTPLGQYYESTMGLILTYDSTTNTFLNTSAQVLYSKTGSFLSSSSFVQSWGTPQVVGNSGSAENCCVPNYINITADPNNPQGLNVTYVLPSNYSTTGGCNEYITDIENGQLQSTLTIQKPSLTQLTWTDGFGTQLYFTRNGNTSQISVQFLQQCVFTMSPTTQPLFGSLTSVKVMELVIGFFILLACI